MKTFLIAIILGTAALLIFGTPLAPERPVVAQRWQSAEPLLSMTFAHKDHVSENCLLCHHNYVDDTGGGRCMTCHVTNEEVAHLLEEQFHALCRDCHTEKSLAGEDSGPTRVCIDCHLDEQLP